MIEITTEQMERVNLILSGIPKAAGKVFYYAINRGLGTVRIQSSKSVAKRYRILQKDFRSAANIREKKASQSDLVGEIAFAGTSIPLIKYNVNPPQPKKQTVSISVLRETTGKELRHAFVARMQSGHVGVFERTTPNVKRLPIDQLYGPPAAGMVRKTENLNEIEAAAQATINTRIEHEITRILNGYGG